MGMGDKFAAFIKTAFISLRQFLKFCAQNSDSAHFYRKLDVLLRRPNFFSRGRLGWLLGCRALA